MEIYRDSEDKFLKWHFPESDFTVMSLWSRYLIVGEERMVNGTGTSIHDLQIDQVDPDWANITPDLDYAIVSTGHWFFRTLYLHEANNLVGCVFCNLPNVTGHDIDFALRMALRAVFNFFNNCHNCNKTTVLLRTFAPAHFEGGAWNTGGYCNRTGPMSEAEVDETKFEFKLRKVQIEEFERGKRRDRENRYEVVDVMRAMMMRPDGHPGEHWGNKWMKGYNDCTHWCVPGPVDFWSEILLAILQQRHPSSCNS